MDPVTADRERIIREIDGLACIRHGGIVSYPDGPVMSTAEAYRALLDTIKRIVRP